MIPTQRTILVGEDDSELRGYFEAVAISMGYAATIAADGAELLRALDRNEAIDLVLLDVILPVQDGIEVLRAIRRGHASIPVIMISDAASGTDAAQAIRMGANGFLLKPINHQELRRAIQAATRVAVESRAGQEAPEISIGSGPLFFGANRRMQDIGRLLRNIGESDAPVLIRGETGAGKEVIARQLHALSARSRRTFLKLNCAALPSELVESELFGYERGAFTGAFQKKLGMFELADGGTILLDEIGDMDVKLQSKLLQVLQDHEFQRVGGKEMIRVDVRVMAATHRDLECAISDRQFREDLYYRLNVIAIEVPALRDRREDIVPMAEFLIQKHCASSPPSLTPALRQALVEYRWPGNIRELENVMRRFIVLRDADSIARELRKRVAESNTAPAPLETTVLRIPPNESGPVLAKVGQASHEAETAAILAALSSTRWNRKQAAILLKIDYKALLYKMKTLAITEEKRSISSQMMVNGGPPLFSSAD